MVVEFAREEVLAKVRANRERHDQEMTEALDAWRGEFAEALAAEIARLSALLERAQSGELRPRDMPHDELHVRSPESHESDYEVSIRMLEMASTQLVSLGETDFARYVLDRWDWRDRFDHYLAEMRSKRGLGRRPRQRP